MITDDMLDYYDENERCEAVENDKRCSDTWVFITVLDKKVCDKHKDIDGVYNG